MSTVAEAVPATNRSLSTLKALFAAVVVLGIILALTNHRVIQEQLNILLEQVNALGTWGGLLFVAGYAMAAVFFVPASLLTIGAGAVGDAIRDADPPETESVSVAGR